MARWTTLVPAAFACAVASACVAEGSATIDNNSRLAAAVAALDASQRAAASFPLNDANVMYVLDEESVSDSVRGKLALTKATSPEVKSYGAMMLAEHRALRTAGKALAAKLGVQPEAPPRETGTARAKAVLDSLIALPRGPEWDKAFIAAEVASHRAVLEKTGRAATTIHLADVVSLINKATPQLEEHLRLAEAIRTRLAGSP
jgi:putative membrane protein